jgi:lipopolysaccharide export system protein LptC
MSPETSDPTGKPLSNQGPNHEAGSVTIWQPRQAEVGQSVAHYSRFVSTMKLALPIAAGIILLLVVILPQFRDDDARFRIGMNLVKGSSNDTLSMTNARYFGTDEKGQPYSVTAQGVRQHAKEDKAIDLVSPKAEVNLTNGTYLQAGASQGLYDRENEKLDLSGEVTVFQDQGNQIKTSQAVVMLKAGTATGRKPVSGEGPYGTMQAEGGFDMSENGRIMNFHGPARVTFNPDSKGTSATPPAQLNPAAAPRSAPKAETKP